jgi:hypothetical protein
LDLTDHFPNPETIASSPPQSLFFMISSSFSTVSPASSFMKPQSSAIFCAISALVRVHRVLPVSLPSDYGCEVIVMMVICPCSGP